MASKERPGHAHISPREPSRTRISVSADQILKLDRLIEAKRRGPIGFNDGIPEFTEDAAEATAAIAAATAVAAGTAAFVGPEGVVATAAVAGVAAVAATAFALAHAVFEDHAAHGAAAGDDATLNTAPQVAEAGTGGDATLNTAPQVAEVEAGDGGHRPDLDKAFRQQLNLAISMMSLDDLIALRQFAMEAAPE